MILCDRWVRKIASTFDIYLGTPRRGGKPSIYLYSILHRPGSGWFGLASVVGDSGHIATVPGRDPGPCISVIGPDGRRFRPKWPSPFAYSTLSFFFLPEHSRSVKKYFHPKASPHLWIRIDNNRLSMCICILWHIFICFHKSDYSNCGYTHHSSII